ncbi:hypothetical protein L532_4284 [Bordetella bronchiseptica OSU095]|nr:hypothetical protein L532_4284 [Bordetella bronchiseptica OSU095]
MATGMKQYLRKWSMMINGQPFVEGRDGPQLRCVFDIDVFPSNTQSFADIQIYNLGKKTTIDRGSDILFSAGYQDKFDIIFAGTVTNVFRERSGPDISTRLLCRSAGTPQNRGLMKSPYGAGASVVDALKDVARAWPLRLEIDPMQFTDKDTFPSGWTAHGDPKQVLEDLKTMFGFEAIEERGTLAVTRIDKERTTNVFEVSQFDGMVGFPEVNRGPQGLGVLVDMRINPFIRVTSRINVKSEFSTYNTGNVYLAEVSGDASANGEYNVFGIKYTGDSHGDIWNMRIDGIRAGTKELLPTAGSGLVWGAKVEQDFRAKVREIAQRLGFDPNWIMSVIAFETGRSFLPSTRNKQSGATGLIQFIPSTARGLGTTTQALANMTAVQQLEYVYEYFRPKASQIRNLADCYMQVLWPVAVGKPDSYVLWTSGSIEYTQNRGLDANHDGTITKGEAAERVERMFKEGLAHKA